MISWGFITEALNPVFGLWFYAVPRSDVHGRSFFPTHAGDDIKNPTKGDE